MIIVGGFGVLGSDDWMSFVQLRIAIERPSRNAFTNCTHLEFPYWKESRLPLC